MNEIQNDKVYRLTYGADAPKYFNDVLVIEVTVTARNLDHAMLLAERRIREQMPAGYWAFKHAVVEIKG